MVYGLVLFLPLFAAFFPTSEVLIVTLWVVALIYALINASEKGRVLFENRLILHLGTVSFSIYLVHVPLRRLLMSDLVSWFGVSGGFVVFVLLVVLVASLTYRLVEAPCIRFGERMFLRWRDGLKER
jgi:peptidoglycan/LPS O-acetylase OafA/YrhL